MGKLDRALVFSGMLAALGACTGQFEESDGLEMPIVGASADPRAGTTGSSPTSVDCPKDAASAPSDLACTGLYSDVAKKVLALDVFEYAPAYPLWSDGAVKSRFIRLPAGSKIDTSNMDEWTFPIGTKLWKEFAIGGKRIETRLSWKTTATTWVHATYRWADDQANAARLDAGATLSLPGASWPYEIPSAAKCATCHDGRIDRVLGFEAVSLGLPQAKGLTLSVLASKGLLSHPPPVTTFVIPDDGTTRAAPALGFLHANCGISCHSTSPNAGAAFKGMNLRLSWAELVPPTGASANPKTFAAWQTTVSVPASNPSTAFMRIAPGDVTRSAIVYLAGRREPSDSTTQMPPLATRVVDTSSLSAVSAWIAAM